MKKMFLIIALAAITATGAFAFDFLSLPPPIKSGNILADLSIGYAGASGFSGSGSSLSFPPISISGEYVLPVNLPISVGAMIAFYQYEFKPIASYKYTWTYVFVGARANWHWDFDVDWLDTYTGLFLGYRYFSSDHDVPSGAPYATYDFGGLAFGGQLGVHFYFTESVGALVEFGYPFLIKAGLALKF